MVLNSPEAKGRTCHGPSIELIFGEWILVSVCVCVCVCACTCMYVVGGLGCEDCRTAVIIYVLG